MHLFPLDEPRLGGIFEQHHPQLPIVFLGIFNKIIKRLLVRRKSFSICSFKGFLLRQHQKPFQICLHRWLHDGKIIWLYYWCLLDLTFFLDLCNCSPSSCLCTFLLIVDYFQTFLLKRKILMIILIKIPSAMMSQSCNPVLQSFSFLVISFKILRACCFLPGEIFEVCLQKTI